MKRIILSFILFGIFFLGNTLLTATNISVDDIWGDYNGRDLATIDSYSMCPDSAMIPMAVARVFSGFLLIFLFTIVLIFFILYKIKKNEKYLKLSVRFLYFFSVIIFLIFIVALYYYLKINNGSHQNNYRVIDDLFFGVVVVIGPLFLGKIISIKFLKKDGKKNNINNKKIK